MIEIGSDNLAGQFKKLPDYKKWFFQKLTMIIEKKKLKPECESACFHIRLRSFLGKVHRPAFIGESWSFHTPELQTYLERKYCDSGKFGRTSEKKEDTGVG